MHLTISILLVSQKYHNDISEHTKSLFLDSDLFLHDHLVRDGHLDIRNSLTHQQISRFLGSMISVCSI